MKTVLHKTRFTNDDETLYIVKFASNDWRFAIREKGRDENFPFGGFTTGPIYPTKTEIFADLHRFATDYGF